MSDETASLAAVDDSRVACATGRSRAARVCEVCGRDSQVGALGQSNGYTIARCANCGLVFIDPLPDAETVRSFYEAAGYAPPMTDTEMRAWAEYKRPEFEELRSAVRLEELPRDAAILDVGCSTGTVLRLFEDSGFRDLTGVEVDTDTAAFVREKFGFDVHAGELEDLSLSRQFDLILFGDSLEHMRRPRAALARAYALTKPGGSVVVRCPNVEGLGMRAARLMQRAGLFRDWFTLELPFHLFHFSPRSIALLLRSVGFRDVRVHTVPVRFPHFSLLRADDRAHMHAARIPRRLRMWVQRALIWLPVYGAAYLLGKALDRRDSLIATASK